MGQRPFGPAVPARGMIKVAHLTKRYGRRLAVDDVSFEVARGEIVGFLGPNGAGKTTTLRVLSGFLPASGGSVEVAGFDVSADSLEVRRRIGYLPESCPLYPEMRVDEYLRYRGRLKGLSGRRLRERVGAVKELCGLADTGRRVIGQLSKGYRQRVGLADALVHEPELLMLDEPTIGLDPNQIRHMRNLIRDLGARYTVLLSTHILPEVEAVCRRVLIVNEGRIVASDTPQMLKDITAGGAVVVAEVRGPREELGGACQGLPSVRTVQLEALGDAGWWSVRLECVRDTDVREEVFALAARRGWALRELTRSTGSLEDVFAMLTRTETEEAAE